jgi:hypothetical protein
LLHRDRSAIVTAYRRPSQRTLTEFGLEAEAVIQIPYLTENEANEIVLIAGGDPAWWGRVAFAAGAQGHPQLVHAFAMGMASRGWPRSEVRDVVIRGFTSDDTDAERDAARRSMVAALSEDARNLLYRLSLTFGRFDRALALRIAEVPIPIQHAGELLDNLIGPWVEVVGKDALRISPLAANAGHGMLTDETQQAIHAAIAIQMLAKRRIDATDADGILTHGLLGKEGRSLFRLASSVLSATSEATELLAEHFFILRIVRTDRPIFEANRATSVLLRLGQLKLLASKGNAKEIAACVESLLTETGRESDATMRGLLDSIALTSIVSTIGIAASVVNWVELLQRFRACVESSPALYEFRKKARASEKGEPSFYGMIFSVGIGHLHSVKRLEEIFVDLDRLNAVDRSLWLEAFEGHPFNYSSLVNPSWSAESRRDDFRPADAAERYKRMAILARKWEVHALAVQCFT